MPIAPDSLPEDPTALKRIIAAMAQDALTAQAEITRLKCQLARYRRAEFGRSSEKLARDTEQLELTLEALEADQAERLVTALPAVAAAVETAAEAQKPARRPLPEHLPREDLRHSAPCTCPNCGGGLRKIGDEVTETLDYVPGRFKVIRHIREKLSCRACDTVVAAPVPDHAIARGRAGAIGPYRRIKVRRPSCVPNTPTAMEVWSCVGDEGRPLGTGDQEPVPNHRELLS